MQNCNQLNAKINLDIQMVKIIAFHKESRLTQFPKELIILYLKILFLLLHPRKCEAVLCTSDGEKKVSCHIIKQILTRRTFLNET